uniref:Sodium/calcium exchanger membrane region domain-containing protein n=1 Tax=Globisporangium ultimum (strain ATCC 200006 / CBS 805.95 / DAOM BR144) TaxID=431595 RepID=K3WM20_GLOUD
MHVSQANASIRRARTQQSDEKTPLLPSGESGMHHASRSYSASSMGAATPSWREDARAIRSFFLGQWLNLLLLAAPLAVWSYAAEWSDIWVFTFNFLVMIPLANMLGEATESLAFHTGETIGGLVNATFGNAVEVVVAVFALRQGEITVVQSSLIGSVLSNLLLVLGCSFIAGGFSQKENKFNATGASANSSLLMLASFAMLLPSYIYYFSDHDDEESRMQKTLALSHIAAIFLLFMYLQLLFFQLHTHIELFQDDQDDEVEMDMSKRASALVLLAATLLVAFFSELLVSSIDGFAQELSISKSFIGIILLPIVGNAVEHVTAVKVALNDKMELAMGVAVGSATQVSLFVVPVVVIAGWILGQPMTLAFPQFEILIYLMSIIIVYGIIADGKSNWLEGSMLVTAYALVAITLIWVHIPSNP